MAYASSTLAVSAANPPILLVRGIGRIDNTAGGVVGLSTGSTGSGGPYGGGSGLWYYCSSDGSTVLKGVGYFTDGQDLGMRLGDAMIAVSATIGSSPVVAIGVLVTTNSTAGWNLASGGVAAAS